MAESPAANLEKVQEIISDVCSTIGQLIRDFGIEVRADVPPVS